MATLRALELLNRVNVEVDVIALEVVAIEVRQFPDPTEPAPALEDGIAAGPDFVVNMLAAGDAPRRLCAGEGPRRGLVGGVQDSCARPPYIVGGDNRLGGRPGGPEGAGRRPRAQVLSSNDNDDPLVTEFVGVVVDGPNVDRMFDTAAALEGATSSLGESSTTLLLPKPSFHFEGFLTICGDGGGASDKVGIAGKIGESGRGSRGVSVPLWRDCDRPTLLKSRAKC